jgi:hypothetical protein
MTGWLTGARRLPRGELLWSDEASTTFELRGGCLAPNANRPRIARTCIDEKAGAGMTEGNEVSGGESQDQAGVPDVGRAERLAAGVILDWMASSRAMPQPELTEALALAMARDLVAALQPQEPEPSAPT